MATGITVSPDRLRWVVRRAGKSEAEAVAAFPLLGGWLDGAKLPTIAQLQKFAAKFHAPFGHLFLTKPPEERIPIPMFRGNALSGGSFNLDLYDTVCTIQRRQEWLEEWLEVCEADTCALVGSARPSESVGEVVVRLRGFLRLDARWAFGLASSDAAVGLLSQRLEDCGVFLAYNGVVGNNTRRPLSVDECRGFAMANNRAPYIFINSQDGKSAQLFTLIHEAAHLMLGVSAGHAGAPDTPSEATERFCDSVAAEFLVPADELKTVWAGDTQKAARRFKVSEPVIARRANDIGLISPAEYQHFWQQYNARPRGEKKKTSGGSFYLTSVKRVGRLFAIHVRNAVNARQLSYTDAYRLTGLYGNTYQHFMANNI